MAAHVFAWVRRATRRRFSTCPGMAAALLALAVVAAACARGGASRTVASALPAATQAAASVASEGCICTSIALTYTALGASVTDGEGASALDGRYTVLYRRELERVFGTEVVLNVEAAAGRTSSRLLDQLRTESTRTALAASQIVTVETGRDEYAAARSLYRSRGCGGPDNQDCLREATALFKRNWDAILRELLSARDRELTIVRTMTFANPYTAVDAATDTWPDDGGLSDFEALKPYIDEWNRHIEAASRAAGIPCARVYRAFNGEAGEDDTHPRGYLAAGTSHLNDAGHRLTADLLRELGFAPLKP